MCNVKELLVCIWAIYAFHLLVLRCITGYVYWKEHVVPSLESFESSITRANPTGLLFRSDNTRYECLVLPVVPRYEEQGFKWGNSSNPETRLLAFQERCIIHHAFAFHHPRCLFSEARLSAIRHSTWRRQSPRTKWKIQALGANARHNVLAFFCWR